MDADVQAIISGDTDRAPIAVANFLKKSSKSFSFPELNHNNYRKELWKSLYNFIKNTRLSQIHADCLTSLRILSRDKTEINEIVNNDLLDALIEHAALKDDKNFEDKHVLSVAVESLKCLVNIIYNSEVAAAISCKNGSIEGIVRRLRTYRDSKLPLDIKLYDMKILFLLTALCAEVRPRLKEELHGLTYLIEMLDLILKESSSDNYCSLDTFKTTGIISDVLADNQVELSCEILKVLYNLTVRGTDELNNEEEEVLYIRLVAILHDYLVVTVRNADKKKELSNHVVNLLTNVPNNCLNGLITTVLDGQCISKDLQFEEHNMNAVAQILQFLKGKFTDELSNARHHELLSPVLSLLLKCVVSERTIRKYVRTQILPPLRDVHNRPEQGSTLRNCMCRLLTTPITQVRDLAAELLYVLCKENVNRMIKYTGYGNAAGLLASRGLLRGGLVDVNRYSSDSEDSDTEEYKEYKHGINPVMGCYEPPHPNPTAQMTEEQKEYEAMKLVELMDNLTRTGIMKPCKIGEDGRPEPVEHILQLQEGLRNQQVYMDDDSD